jgi:hypothetical protein
LFTRLLEDQLKHQSFCVGGTINQQTKNIYI